MTHEAWSAILTPERMRGLVQECLAERPGDDELGAPIGLLVRRLMALEDSPGGGFTLIRSAVRAAVESTPGLRYVEVPE